MRAGLFALLLTLTMASALAVPPPVVERDYPHDFVAANQSRYEAYLAELQALWSSCCADRELNYPSVSAPPCPEGDLFQSKAYWSPADQHKRPVDGGLQQLFTTKVDSYRVCEIPAEEGCMMWGTRWHLSAESKGQIGGGAVTLDGGRCTVTVNRVRLDYEGYARVGYKQLSKDLRQTTLTGSGQPLTVRVHVVGPAVMTRYTPVWTAEHGTIRGRGGFVKDGSQWTAEAVLGVPGEPADVRMDVKLGEQVYNLLSTKIVGHAPPLEGIQLKYAGGDLLLDQPLYLFYPTDGIRVALPLSTEARLLNGQVVANWAAPGIDEPSFMMEDEKIATFSSPAGLTEGIHYLLPQRYGETRLMVEYPKSIEFTRDKTFYEMYPVRVLELTLARVYDAAGQTRLRLLARGPDPTVNKVHWDGKAAGSMAFQKEQGYWVAEFPDDGVSSVQVMDPAGQELAMLDVAMRLPADAAAIQILPPAPPNYTVFKEMPMPSTNIDLAGWAISSGFCNKANDNRLPQAMSEGKSADQLQGLLTQARNMCQNQEQLRQNQEEIRRIVPEINRLVRELAKGGSELLGLEDDSIAVGAGIKGMSEHLYDRAYCRWSLKEGGESKLAFEYTAVQRVDESSGACFNRVTNLVKGFQPGMKVAVELIVGL